MRMLSAELSATEALAAYERITHKRTRFVRVDELCASAAKDLQGFMASAEELQAEAALALKDKKGLEAAQERFLGRVLADPGAGAHLCHALLLPHPKLKDRLA